MTDRDAIYRGILEHPGDDTPRLIFADWFDEHSEPDRATFIRCQIAIAAFATLGDTIDGPLRSRERALFAVHGAEWFGPKATLSPPTQAAIEYTGPSWYRIVPARGFPAHWYGPWEKWVGGVCGECGGRGGLHNDMHYSDDPCPAKCVSGRIPGACATLAWRKGWDMECGQCEGAKVIEKVTGSKCPSCGGPGRWRSGVGFDHEKICMSKKHERSVVWEPGEPDTRTCLDCHGSGRVPRPCPSGAVPLSDIYPTTRPDDFDTLEGAQEVWSRNHDARYWIHRDYPGLRFHLPSERRETTNYTESAAPSVWT